MDFHSELTLKIDNPKRLQAIYEAIKPETTIMISPRGKCSIEIVGQNTILMKFYAFDFISLRAMLGSFLRWIDVAINSIQPSKKI